MACFWSSGVFLFGLVDGVSLLVVGLLVTGCSLRSGAEV
jgi:hypothetical protein